MTAADYRPAHGGYPTPWPQIRVVRTVEPMLDPELYARLRARWEEDRARLPMPEEKLALMERDLEWRILHGDGLS